MKTKITLFSITFLLVTAFSFAQKTKPVKSIIKTSVTIEKYHSSEELEQMQKGKLLELYIERITVLSNTIPYIAFATKPGVTMTSMGIPNSSENRKKLDSQHENTDEYIANTIDFQKTILPYSDKQDLARAVFFYEEIMKSLHTYDEFH